MVTHRGFSVPSSCLDAFLARYPNCHAWRRNYLALRLASTSSTDTDNPYPFPAHRNPTPHQIFHIAASATKEDLKARYYDLVRIYHPDKAGLLVSPDIAHARFRAITTAYDILRKKECAADIASASSGLSVWTREGEYPTTAAWRAASQARRAQELYSGGKADDRWKDRLFLAGVVLTFSTFILQMTIMRREAMSDVAAIRTQRAVANVDNGGNRTGKPEDTKRLRA